MKLFSKLQKYSKSGFLKIFIMLFVFITWLFPYSQSQKGIEVNIFFENFGLIFAGALCLVFLIIFENVTLPLQLLITVPFIFSHPLTLNNIPYNLFICLGLVILGFICHIIIYHKRFNAGKMAIGFIIMAIGFIFGGFFIERENKTQQMILLAFLGLLFVFLYMLSITYSKDTFNDLSHIMTLIGLLLFMQVASYGVLNKDLPDLFQRKFAMSLGWATNINSLGVILLFTIPFSFYVYLNKKGLLSFAGYIITILQLLTLIISFSRGSLLSALITYLLMFISLLFVKKYRLRTFMFMLTFFIFISIGYSTLQDIKPELLESMIEEISKFNLDSLNGRKDVYKVFIDGFKENPQYIFGFGFYDLYGKNEWMEYLWAHNTFLHVFYCCGIVGLSGMLIHYIQKYFYVLKKINLEKSILLFAFIATDFYGFFDVTYFFPNFMIMLFIVLIMSNSLFERGKDNA